MWFPGAFAVDENREDFVSAAFENLTHPTLLTWSDFKLFVLWDFVSLHWSIWLLVPSWILRYIVWYRRFETTSCVTLPEKRLEIVQQLPPKRQILSTPPIKPSYSKRNNPRPISCTLHLPEIDHQIYYHYTVSWVTHSAICSKFLSTTSSYLLIFCTLFGIFH